MKFWDHHKPLLLELEPINGFYIPEMPLPNKPSSEIEWKIPNKGYRNFAYWINSFLLNTDQSFINTGGTNRIILQFKAGTSTSASVYSTAPEFGRFEISYGSSSSPHDVSRRDLYSRHSTLSFIDGFAWTVNETDKTKIMQYARYIIPPPSLSCGEAGLYLSLVAGHDTAHYNHFLLARAIIDPSVTKEYDTLYEEGWIIEFPANYTRILPNVLAYCAYHSHPPKFNFYDTSGAAVRIRSAQPFAGSPDVMIGSDNTAPSPDDYNLKSPIGSLSSQAHSVEIDTTLQECRIVRQGTYTPTTNVYLGEIGLFANVYNDADTSIKMMIARGIWETPVLLQANITYTIGIVLKLG
ncbi:MAG: hypothetical protein QXK24_07950 [Ignisphaera sp.]